ncbi:hypothetical protein ACJRO7_003728 [Eucalyptus globulus]|uniref:MI domain-containing protein n=1 Tax=Eucalyptus globulus TaxID=34317 RepID=A0ABD3IV06_EUCGL
MIRRRRRRRYYGGRSGDPRLLLRPEKRRRKGRWLQTRAAASTAGRQCGHRCFELGQGAEGVCIPPIKLGPRTMKKEVQDKRAAASVRKSINGIFEWSCGILHEAVHFLIEGLFAIRKDRFWVNQLTYEISLQEDVNPELSLDIFKPDLQFMENEKHHEELKKTIHGDESEEEEDSEEGIKDRSAEESDEEEDERMKIKDETETNLVNLRRMIYLTIMSRVDFVEAGHKLLKIKVESGQELHIKLLECCSQERTYLHSFGLLGQCSLHDQQAIFDDSSFETNKMRDVAKNFAHLLGVDALPWHVCGLHTSRICLFNECLNDPSMQDSFDSIFPKGNPRNTRFSINFFTSIGLHGVTENLREYLKNMPCLIMQQQQASSSSDNGLGSSSSSSPESCENDRDRKCRKQTY